MIYEDSLRKQILRVLDKANRLPLRDIWVKLEELGLNRVQITTMVAMVNCSFEDITFCRAYLKI